MVPDANTHQTSSIGRVLDPGAFKAYDVRAVYPAQLDEEGAYAIGRAFAEQFEPRRIAIGRDMRLSSPTMADAVINGVADAGTDVADLGMVGTEMVYFATGELGLDGGIMVTASHNPAQYTGMKIVRRGALPVGSESGLFEIRDRAVRGEWRSSTRGTVEPVDVWDDFVDRVLSFIDASALRPVRIVVDAANGMAGVMLPPVLERLPQVEVVRCNFEPDGSFPNHEPNPLLPENREFIVRRTREEGAAFGVAYDGDADRCFFVDDTRRVRARGLHDRALRRADAREGAGREGDLRRAGIVGGAEGDRASRRGAAHQPRRPLVHQAADARGRRRLRRRGLGALLLPRLLAGRLGRDSVPADARARLPRRQAAERDPGAAPHAKYFLTGEINTPVADVALKLQELKERYASEGRISHLDGLSVDADDWHMNVRPSNTEPLLRLNLEALSEQRMEEKRDEVLAVIRS